MNAIYPGTFDPMTKGHLDIVERGVLMFKNLTIGVAENKRKTPMFNINERVEIIKDAVKHIQSVKVKPFSCLLVDFMRQENAKIILRGLRAVSDFEFEFQLALMNRKLDEECETVFLMPNKKYIFLSSSMIREIAMLGGDVSQMVPEKAMEFIRRKYKSETSK